MKANWPYYCGGVGGCIKFVGAKNRLDNSKDINTPVASTMEKALKTNKKSKDKDLDESDCEDKLEQFNFKNLRSELSTTPNNNVAGRRG